MGERRPKKNKEPRLAALYYRVRRGLGLPELSLERQRRQKILEPERDVREALVREDEQRLERGLLCLAAAAVLMLVSSAVSKGSRSLTLTRPGYGEAEEEVSLRVESEEEAWDVSLQVGSLRYTQEEWEEKREEAWENVRVRALGENPDWDAVSSDLDFSPETGVAGITVEWSTEDASLISFDGEVGEREEQSGEQAVLLHATLRCGEWEWTQDLTATVVPVARTQEEENRRELRQFLQSAVDDGNEESVTLPESYRGSPLWYRSDDPIPAWMIGGLGLLAAAAFWLLPEQRRQEQEKKRRRELTIAYPELVSSLTVLIRAGLTVRGAWVKMTEDYRLLRQRGGEKKILYEEMSLTLNSLGQGVYEEAAYVAFGRRCGLRPYLRLGSLLETNLKKGSRSLLPLLRQESDNAMEERLQSAKKLGEEASTRLLFPMMLLFALVLAILIVPAFWSF